MHIRPAADLSPDPAPASLNEARLRIVTDSYRAYPRELQKRLITELYEKDILSMEETAALIARLGLAEA